MRLFRVTIMGILSLIMLGCWDDCRNGNCPVKAHFVFKIFDAQGNNLIERSANPEPYNESITVTGVSNTGKDQEIDLIVDGIRLYLYPRTDIDT